MPGAKWRSDFSRASDAVGGLNATELHDIRGLQLSAIAETLNARVRDGHASDSVAFDTARSPTTLG
jgi:hypothetical protein